MIEQIFTSPSPKTTLAKKLKLEATFYPEVKAYFNTIRMEFEKFYSVTGRAISMEQYEPMTLSLIDKQYRRVTNAFKNDLRGEKKQDDTLADEETDIINTAIITFVLLKSKISALQILDTNAKNITEAIGRARIALFEKGIPETNKAIAQEASAILKTKFNGRANTIAISETQHPAEAAKSIEANVLAGEAPAEDLPIGGVAAAGYIVKKATKTWRAVLDEKTRGFHAVADGQTVNITQSFFVGGEYLRYPRASEASAKNIVNCRCSSETNIIRNLLN